MSEIIEKDSNSNDSEVANSNNSKITTTGSNVESEFIEINEKKAWLNLYRVSYLLSYLFTY